MVKPGNLFLRLFWAFFFLVGFCGAIFMIHQAVEQFLQFGVITTIKIKKEKEMIFPALTFCADYDSFSSEIIPMNYDMIVDCSIYESYSINGYSSKKCTFTNLTLFDHRVLKKINCIQLNYGNNKDLLFKVKEEGHKYGFALEFKIPINTSLYFVESDNNDHIAYNDIVEFLYPGHETYIALSKTEQTALGPPYSHCNDSVGYKQTVCVENCYNKNMSESCQCKYPDGCLSLEKWSSLCWKSYNTSESLWFDCRIQCPVECNLVTYSFNRIDFKSVEENSARLNIYFYKLETTHITQSESITLTSLIANVGGLLGKMSLCKNLNLLIY